MLTRSIKEARSTFSALIERVQNGETISITRHGKQAACLVPSTTAGTKLPSLRAFRAKIASAKSPLSHTVLRSRAEARF
jgi:prevent-host-death family protein